MGRRPATVAALWLIVCVLLTYLPSVGRGFVADDFGWIFFSRLDSPTTAWKLLIDGAPGFYRPIVALSFGLNETLFGMSPAGYAWTNLAMAFGIMAGIVWLGTSFGLPPAAGVFGAGLWILNFHGISSALIWISGRTSLLTTLFAVFAAVALIRGRSFLSGWLTLASLMSKEEPVMLPVVFAAWLWIDRRPLADIARHTWPSFAALGVYLALRARTDAFTPATAPSFYRLSASPDVLLPNTLAYLDRSMTFTAAVLVLGWMIFARTRGHWREAESRTAAKGMVWLILGFTVTIMIPVRSSLYVVFPTVGSALIGMAAGNLMWRSIAEPRRRATAVAILLLPLLVLPIHWRRHQTSKLQAMLSTQVLEIVRSGIRESPDTARIVVLDDGPGRVTAASAFGAELPRAVELVAGKPLTVELVAPEHAAGADHLLRTPDTIVVRVDEGQATLVRR
jgi:hypothetical protein